MASSRYQDATETLEPVVNYQRAAQISSSDHVLPEMTTDADRSIISGVGLLAAEMTGWSHAESKTSLKRSEQTSNCVSLIG